MLLIQVHDVDREPHSEGVNRFARPDPKRVARRQFIAAQEALPPARARARKFSVMRKLCIARAIEDAQPLARKTS